MAERLEVRFAGSGGQGIILMGLILAEAAGLFEGKFVCQTQSYGPEARGGAAKAEVVISEAEIDYPKALQPDILVAMNQAAADIYGLDLKHGGLLLVDRTLVRDFPSPKAIALPFTATARQEIRRELMANIIALGALVRLSGIVSRGSLEKALLKRAPAGTAAVNLQALGVGIKLAEEFLAHHIPKCLEEVGEMAPPSQELSKEG